MNDAQPLAVHGARFVRVVKAEGRLRDDLGAEIDGHRDVLSLERTAQRRERDTDHQLHHEIERVVVGAPEIQSGDDVRARDVRGDLGLVEEHAHEALVGREVGQHALERDELLEAALAYQARDVHFGHAAGRDAKQRLVATEPDAGGSGLQLSWLGQARSGYKNGRAVSAMCRSLVCGAVLLATLATLAATPASAQSRRSDREEARALFAAGQAAVDAGRWTDALDAFHRAYALVHVPSALFNAAFALRALGRYLEAQEAFEELVGLHGMTPAMLTEARGYLAEVRGRIGHIRLDGLPDDEITTLHLDAEGVVDNGSRPFVLSADPGHHAIDISLTGHDRFEWVGDLADGQTLRVAVSLPLSPVVSVGGPTEIWQQAWFWVVIGVAVAGIAAGIVGGIIADQQAQIQPGPGGMVVHL